MLCSFAWSGHDTSEGLLLIVMDFVERAPRYLFFTGKGGVGKTSIACATAIALAESGSQVLIVCTDPASNLHEVLATSIGQVPVLVGAFAGVALAHIMFAKPALFFASHHERSGIAQFVSECVATFGLLAVIWGSSRRRQSAVPFAVGAYITAAYWFTSSTSFANPAVTMARAVSDTFAGIRPADVPAFIVAQLIGAAAATALFRWLVPNLPRVAPRVIDRLTTAKDDEDPT